MLSERSAEVSLPDCRDTDLLGVDGVRDVVDCHLENDVGDGDDLGQLLLSALFGAQLEDGVQVERLVLELVGELGCDLDCPLGDLGPLEIRNGDRPVVEGGTQSDGTVLEADLPLLVERCGESVCDLLVELSDDLGELLDHHLRGELLLDDGPVDLVDEEHGLDTLLHRLPDDSLGLRHDSLDGAAQDVHSVQSPHGPGDISSEVDVSGSVDEVDQVVVDLVGLRIPVWNDHRRGCGVDGDTSGGLLLIVIEQALLTGGLGRHHSGTRDQVIGECRLSMVDMRCGSEIPDVGLILHQLDCFLGVVLSASHVHNLRLVHHLAD